MTMLAASSLQCLNAAQAAAIFRSSGPCPTPAKALKCSRNVGFLESSQRGARLLGPQGGARLNAWFRFGNRGLDSEGAGIYGSQGRDEFDRDDVEQYFNYMGMLATEGTYDKMEALLSKGIHPVDILLLLAASEGDTPKIEELLRAGARCDVQDVEGRTAVERASSDEIKELIKSRSVLAA